MTIRWFVELISNFIAANWSEERDRWLFNVPRLKVDRHVEGPEWNISNNLISVSLCLPLIISDIFCWSSNSNKQKCSSSPLFLLKFNRLFADFYNFLFVFKSRNRNNQKNLKKNWIWLPCESDSDLPAPWWRMFKILELWPKYFFLKNCN